LIKSGDAAIVTFDSQQAALNEYFSFKVDRRTGKSTEDAPKFIKSGDAAIVTDSQQAALNDYLLLRLIVVPASPLRTRPSSSSPAMPPS
jgi:hypothetical protein